MSGPFAKDSCSCTDGNAVRWYVGLRTRSWFASARLHFLMRGSSGARSLVGEARSVGRGRGHEHLERSVMVVGKVYGGGGGYGRCDGRVEMNGLKGVPTGLEEGVEKRRMAHEEKQRGDNKSVVRDGSRGCNRR